VILVALAAGACAPAGYMYETGSFIPHPTPAYCQSQGQMYDVGAQRCSTLAPPPPVAQLPPAYPPAYAAQAYPPPAYTPPTAPSQAPAYTPPPAPSPPLVAQVQPPQPQPAEPSVPVEKDAVIYDDFKGNTKLMNALATMVRLNDYRCDSISALRPYITVKGFKLVCNNFDYSYDIEDKGGHWVVKVE
jgi:hypothetical protein